MGPVAQATPVNRVCNPSDQQVAAVAAATEGFDTRGMLKLTRTCRGSTGWTRSRVWYLRLPCRGFVMQLVVEQIRNKSQ